MQRTQASSPRPDGQRPARDPFDRCTTRSRKILQFQHYCTDAPI